jgi:hypothetical protein
VAQRFEAILQGWADSFEELHQLKTLQLHTHDGLDSHPYQCHSNSKFDGVAPFQVLI